MPIENPCPFLHTVLWFGNMLHTLERYTLLALYETIVSSKPEVLLTVFHCFLIYISRFSAEVVCSFGLFFFIPADVVEHSQHFLFVSCSFCKAEEIERSDSLSEVKMKDKFSYRQVVACLLPIKIIIYA